MLNASVVHAHQVPMSLLHELGYSLNGVSVVMGRLIHGM